MTGEADKDHNLCPINVRPLAVFIAIMLLITLMSSISSSICTLSKLSLILNSVSLTYNTVLSPVSYNIKILLCPLKAALSIYLP